MGRRSYLPLLYLSRLIEMGNYLNILNHTSQAVHFDASHVTTGKYGDKGRYVTTHSGHVIFIVEGGGFVPKHLRADDQEIKHFSRAALERKLIHHHEELEGGHTAHADEQLSKYVNPFKFRADSRGRLPEEIANYLDKHSAERHLFELAKPGETAQGEDVIGELGIDRYLDIARGMSEGRLTAAKAFAEKSPDPEIQFLNHIHENLPTETAQGLRAKATKLRNRAAGKHHEERAKLLAEAERHEARAREAAEQKMVAVEPGKLRVGAEFTIHGHKFRVAEDENGYKVLQSEHDYHQHPVDALRSVPVDQGSFRQGRLAKPVDDIPFASGYMAFMSDLFGRESIGGTQRHLFDLDDRNGVWRTIHHVHVFIRDGKITRGPHNLQGRTLSEAHEHVVGPNEHAIGKMSDAELHERHANAHERKRAIGTALQVAERSPLANMFREMNIEEHRGKMGAIKEEIGKYEREKAKREAAKPKVVDLNKQLGMFSKDAVKATPRGESGTKQEVKPDKGADRTKPQAEAPKRSSGKAKSEWPEWNAHGSDTLKTISDIVSKEEHQSYGLRWVHPNQKNVKAGTALPRSWRWDDGNQTNDRLEGTSAVFLHNSDNPYLPSGEDIQSAISRLGTYHGANGKHIVLVGGDWHQGGNDEGEAVIHNAKILHAWRIAEESPESPAPASGSDTHEFTHPHPSGDIQVKAESTGGQLHTVTATQDGKPIAPDHPAAQEVVGKAIESNDVIAKRQAIEHIKATGVTADQIKFLREKHIPELQQELNAELAGHSRAMVKLRSRQDAARIIAEQPYSKTAHAMGFLDGDPVDLSKYAAKVDKKTARINALSDELDKSHRLSHMWDLAKSADAAGETVRGDAVAAAVQQARDAAKSSLVNEIEAGHHEQPEPPQLSPELKQRATQLRDQAKVYDQWVNRPTASAHYKKKYAEMRDKSLADADAIERGQSKGKPSIQENIVAAEAANKAPLTPQGEVAQARGHSQAQAKIYHTHRAIGHRYDCGYLNFMVAV